MNRRHFLKSVSAVTTGLMLPYSVSGKNISDKLGELLPRRVLGLTGESVTMLGIGGYHIGWTTDKDAREVIETALENGIRFFDTAESYAKGLSEERYGTYLTPQYRDEVFLMTKTTARDANSARQHLEGSLRRLKTEYLDLWQVHSLQSPEDVEARINNGILDVMLEAIQKGKVRHIGFTGHASPDAHLKMLELTAGNPVFETCQMPVNIVDAASSNSFIHKVFPVLTGRKMGIIAMKSLADGRFFSEKVQTGWTTDNPVIPEKMSVREALNYTWSLPVSVLVTGAENKKLLEEKISCAREFVRLSEEEREKLIGTVLSLSEEGLVEYYKEKK